MLRTLPREGDLVWMVKVSKTGRLYAKQLPVLVVDSRRISVACEGRRLTWDPRRAHLFATAHEALRAAEKLVDKRRAREEQPNRARAA
jgi:hypothetical protein